MPTYLYLGKYTAKGMAGAMQESFAARDQEIRGLMESLGGKVLNYSFCLGEYDFVIMAELPDTQSALVAPMMAGAADTVRVVTIELMSAADMDRTVSLMNKVRFRVAGGA